MSAPLIVLTGSPGSGKSTAARLVADAHAKSVVVEGDAFFNFLRSGKIPPWLPESHDQNTVITQITVDVAVGYARAGWTTILEGIFGPWFLPTVATRCGGLDLHYLVLDAPLATCLERFNEREPDSSSDVVEKMHGEFARSAIDARHVIPAHDAPEAVAADILERITARTAMIEP